jgi:hypothetical protein
MTINRRRAPSSKISSEKKLSGHRREQNYASLIGGKVIGGTQKGDVKDKNGDLHSVKSGKKWQVFLYGYNRICNSSYLSILQPCLDAFPEDSNQYFEDRIKCIAFKEAYVEAHGRNATKSLSNNDVAKHLGANTYVESKNQLATTTSSTCNTLNNKANLRNFLDEALFNNDEVKYLAIKDSTYKKDGLFKVFAKEDVLDILTAKLFPSVSIAGRVPVDYNVAGQKTLLCYKKTARQTKNIVEIEIRNDSSVHYRQVRFNMYSKDALSLLLEAPQCIASSPLGEHIVVYGQAIKTFIEKKMDIK